MFVPALKNAPPDTLTSLEQLLLRSVQSVSSLLRWQCTLFAKFKMNEAASQKRAVREFVY